MPYQAIKPHPSLEPYIDSIWVHEYLHGTGIEFYPPTRVLPSGVAEMVFHYGDEFVHLVDGREKRLPRTSISGQQTQYRDLLGTGTTGIILVRFKPWGVAPLLRLLPEELIDRTVPLTSITNDAAVRIVEEQLHEARDTSARVEIVQAFLNSLLGDQWFGGMVQEAVARIYRTRGGLPIRILAQELRLSERQLERRFKQTIGVSPKQFARVMRFQASIAYRRRGMDWDELIYRCGYYDQSYFANEFKQFAGASPQTSFLVRPPTMLGRYFNANRRASGFSNTFYV